MLFQPTNLIPSSLRGGGGDVIDASGSADFSFQLNGTSPCVAYQIVIMQNDTSSTKVYDTGKITLADAVYPRDYENNPQRITVAIPSTSGMYNGYENGYKWTVSLWYDNTNYITSSDTFFWAKADPFFSMASPPSTVTEKNITLQGVYTQSNGTPLAWFEWVLHDENGNVIKDTGKVYSQDIRFVFDGLISDTTYTYELSGETDDGVTVPTYTATFDVSYDMSGVEIDVTTSCDSNIGSINVSFPMPNIIYGEANNTGVMSYLSNTPLANHTSISLLRTAKITFDKVNATAMALPFNSTHIWSGRATLDSELYAFSGIDDNGDEFTASLSYVYATSTWVYSYNDTTILSVQEASTVSMWFIAYMYKDSILLRVFRLESGEYALYNEYSNWDADGLETEGAIVSSISMEGQQICDYIYIEEGVITVRTSTVETVPEWGDNTLLYAPFENTLGAGDMGIDFEINKWSLYRREADSTALQHIGDMSIAYNQFTDYMAKNNESYIYYLFPTNDEALGSPLISANANTFCWNWVLLIAEEKLSDAQSDLLTFKTAYVFQGNVSSGSLSNNASGETYANFTRYPKVVKGTQNYLSGTLTTLIGKIDLATNSYIQSVGLMRELMELSTMTNRMFLKNRAGEIWEISVTDSMDMAVQDSSSYQPYTASIPWVEINDATDVALIKVGE